MESPLTFHTTIVDLDGSHFLSGTLVVAMAGTDVSSVPANDPAFLNKQNQIAAKTFDSTSDGKAVDLIVSSLAPGKYPVAFYAEYQSSPDCSAKTSVPADAIVHRMVIDLGVVSVG